MWEIILTVTAAVLAVFGLYCLCKIIAAAIFAPSCIAAAVVISSIEDAENLSENLGQAAAALFRTRNKKIIVIISENLLYGCIGECGTLREDYMKIIEDYGAELIIAPYNRPRKRRKNR